MRMPPPLLLALVAAVSTAMWPAAAVAQPPQRTAVSGVVRDASGAVLPGATITATEVVSGGAATVVAPAGAAATTLSGGDGRYLIELPPGEFRIRVELDGFEAHDERLTVRGAAMTRDVVLALPVYADTVVVTGTRSPSRCGPRRSPCRSSGRRTSLSAPPPITVTCCARRQASTRSS